MYTYIFGQRIFSQCLVEEYVDLPSDVLEKKSNVYTFFSLFFSEGRGVTTKIRAYPSRL